MLSEALQKFHRRAWKNDVAYLNEVLAKRGTDAGLKSTPPSIITGDPFALPVGRCLLVLGINPRWPSDPQDRKRDCDAAEQAWDQGFDSYRLHRQGYFSEGLGQPGKTKKGDDRYSRHFSKLGNSIAHSIGSAHSGWDAGPNARRLFRERAAIFDLIPYWSTDTSNLDISRIDPGVQDCVRDWHEVIHAFIAEKKPAAIIVNNCGQPKIIEAMLGCSLDRFLDTPCSMGRVGKSETGSPILAHPFLSNWRTTRADYVRMMRCWMDLMGADLRVG